MDLLPVDRLDVKIGPRQMDVMDVRSRWCVLGVTIFLYDRITTLTGPGLERRKRVFDTLFM